MGVGTSVVPGRPHLAPQQPRAGFQLLRDLPTRPLSDGQGGRRLVPFHLASRGKGAGMAAVLFPSGAGLLVYLLSRSSCVRLLLVELQEFSRTLRPLSGACVVLSLVVWLAFPLFLTGSFESISV